MFHSICRYRVIHAASFFDCANILETIQQHTYSCILHHHFHQHRHLFCRIDKISLRCSHFCKHHCHLFFCHCSFLRCTSLYRIQNSCHISLCCIQHLFGVIRCKMQQVCQQLCRLTAVCFDLITAVDLFYHTCFKTIQHIFIEGECRIIQCRHILLRHSFHVHACQVFHRNQFNISFFCQNTSEIRCKGFTHNILVCSAIHICIDLIHAPKGITGCIYPLIHAVIEFSQIIIFAVIVHIKGHIIFQCIQIHVHIIIDLQRFFPFQCIIAFHTFIVFSVDCRCHIFFKILQGIEIDIRLHTTFHRTGRHGIHQSFRHIQIGQFCSGTACKSCHTHDTT